jgi:hypothetical protein
MASANIPKSLSYNTMRVIFPNRYQNMMRVCFHSFATGLLFIYIFKENCKEVSIWVSNYSAVRQSGIQRDLRPLLKYKNGMTSIMHARLFNRHTQVRLIISTRVNINTAYSSLTGAALCSLSNNSIMKDYTVLSAYTKILIMLREGEGVVHLIVT